MNSPIQPPPHRPEPEPLAEQLFGPEVFAARIERSLHSAEAGTPYFEM
jgi:hypothetical protein